MRSPARAVFFIAIKRFLGNISLAVALNLLVKPGWVVLENVVQDRLGHATFGLVAALTAFALVVTTVFDLGLTPYSVKRIAAETDFLGETFPVVLPLRGWLGLPALGLMLAGGWLLGYRSWSSQAVLAAVGAMLLLTQFSQFLRSTLQARQLFNADTVASVLEKLVALAAVAGLLLAGRLTLAGYVGARLGAALVVVGAVFGLMRRLVGRVRPRWHWRGALATLRDSLPFAFITVLYGINERVDMVMLERLAVPTEAGYYAAAYRWVDAVMMYVWTVLPLFFAKFAAQATDRAAQRELLWFGQRVVTLPLLLLVAFVWFRGEVLFWQFAHSTAPELARMTWCLKILFINVLVHGFFALYAALLNSTGHVRPVSWLVALSVTLNVVLNVLLLPRFGAVAAAYNTLACAAVVSVGYVVLVWRVGVAVPWRLLGQLVGVLACTFAAWAGLQAYAHLPWLLETLAAAAAFGLSVLGWRVVTLAELRQLRPGSQLPEIS